MDAVDHLLKIVGAIVIGVGGLSLIVYQAFKHLAARWLDARLDERLQALKHEQEKELEQLRFKISALLDRATKLHPHKRYPAFPFAFRSRPWNWRRRSWNAGRQRPPEIV